jgi:hypothetical protein
MLTPSPPKPLIHWVLRLFPGSTAAACGISHPPLLSAKVKCEWSFTSSHCMCLHGMDKGNFYIFFYDMYE